MRSRRAWYNARFEEFVIAEETSILGELVANCEFQITPEQRVAWQVEILMLKRELVGLEGTIYLEFSVPRMGKRIDAVLVLAHLIVVLEFKVGESTFTSAAYEQVWDYALDLKNFHLASHTVPIVPVLVATDAKRCPALELRVDNDQVYRPILATTQRFGEVLALVQSGRGSAALRAAEWAAAPYSPTPTIIDAARALYAQHSVKELTRHDAGENLAVTAQRLHTIIDTARARGRKAICLVTGVPGAGKTLVGLDVATQRGTRDALTHAVYLSGNGPLVKVLVEALARDEVARRSTAGEKVPKGKVRDRIKSFIQNVHHFRDEGLIDTGPPFDHVVIFDEAQRAWTLEKTTDFMARKKKRPGFNQSEAAFLISYMDRHEDWATIICLIGGGQEINTGEAGIRAWLDAITESFPEWDLHISSRLTDREYDAAQILRALKTRPNTYFDDALHLAVSMRSFRAEHVSSFVRAVLDLEESTASELLQQILPKYPIVVTRSLDAAKQWVRSKARGSERYGLIASSKAQRLKPHAIDIRVEIDPVHWFLNDRDDTRSSYFLEDAATEFQVQGLELDWTCVTWDADLRYGGGGWSFHDFRGSRWVNVNNAANRSYLLNSYRVLLTRARQGMVLFVPEGSPDDATRRPAFYDETFGLLRRVGVPAIC